MQKLLEGKSDKLIIFIKYPQAGRVKTRLARSIGRENAARLYRAFVEAILKRTKCKSFQRVIFYNPARKEKETRNWLGEAAPGSVFALQRGRDLGERLSHAFKFAFDRGAARAVAIGSDSPLIDKALIVGALRKLRDVRCVIGPALDGGYYLIGLSSLNEKIFQGIHWGTESVLGQTIAKLKQLKIKYALLSKSFDIDSYQDIILFKKKMQSALRINPLGLAHLYGILEKLEKKTWTHFSERKEF